MSEALILFCNLPDGESAHALARHLVERRLAACVNILPAVRSVYRWEGKTEEADEVTVMIKSTKCAYPALEATIRAMHEYDVPEIIALPIVAGLPAYLDWLVGETKEEGND
jgi:periplasmic divalent cation tolerance protein